METADKKLTIVLLRLHCYFVEETGYDDVFLKFQGKKIWPQNKKQQPVMMDSTTELNLEIKNISRYSNMEVELWDWDLLSPNDKLGVFRMNVDGSPGPFSTDMVQNLKETRKAKYTLDWEVY